MVNIYRNALLASIIGITAVALMSLRQPALLCFRRTMDIGRTILELDRYAVDFALSKTIAFE